MQKFVYKVKNNVTGKIEVSEAEAESKDALVDLLHNESKTVISITELKPGSVRKKTVRSFISFKSLFGVGLRDKIDFCEQFAALLEGGITLIRCLEILSLQIQNLKFKSIITSVKEDVRSGLALHKAFAKYPNVFSPLWVNLVETGEASGELPYVLRELSKYFELSVDIKTKLTTALIYPIIVLIASAAAMIVFITLLVPMFETLFKSFGASLPFMTVIVINISGFIRSNLWYIFLFFVIAVIILKKYLNTQAGKGKFDRIKLSLPVLGPFFINVAMVKFSNALGVLMKGGVPILYSLEVVTKVVGNSIIAGILNNVKNDVRSGKSMASSLNKNAKIIPPIVIQMVQVGEETGELNSMLERLSEFYRGRLDTFVARFSTIIEPAMILFVGAIVAFLVISMFLPIFMRASLAG